jgi:hypothetical protein
MTTEKIKLIFSLILKFINKKRIKKVKIIIFGNIEKIIVELKVVL